MRHPDELMETIRPHLAVLKQKSSSKPLKVLLEENEKESLRRQRALKALKPAYDEIMMWSEEQIKNVADQLPEVERSSFQKKVKQTRIALERFLNGIVLDTETELLMENLKFFGARMFCEKTGGSIPIPDSEKIKPRTIFKNIDASLSYESQVTEQAKRYKRMFSENVVKIVGFSRQHTQEALRLPWDCIENVGLEVDHAKVVSLTLGLSKFRHETIYPLLVRNKEKLSTVTLELVREKLVLIDKIKGVSRESIETIKLWTKEDYSHPLPGYISFSFTEEELKPKKRLTPKV
jgi:hypothetical protein